MNVVFAGTPAFAVPSLQALVSAGHRISAVYTQPDRPSGRGRCLHLSPVKLYAQEHGLPIHQPLSLKGEIDVLQKIRPDIMVVVAYGHILPPSILAVPVHGCVNVHASLLPRWRGAAPIARAIEAGDSTTGITLMQMDAGMDTGDILATVQLPITEQETAATLHDKLAPLGARLLTDMLEKIIHHDITPRSQEAQDMCMAPKLRKNEAWLDWAQPAIRLQRKIRAYLPWPVACTHWRGRTLRLWEADVTTQTSEPSAPIPGTVVGADNEGITVDTGNGLLRILRLQIEGGKSLAAADFLHGHRMLSGDQLITPPEHRQRQLA